jgi:hypothetical protein
MCLTQGESCGELSVDIAVGAGDYGHTGTALTSTRLHALLLCPEVVPVAIAPTKFELCALSRGRVITPPGQQGSAVASHGWKTAHILCGTQNRHRQSGRLHLLHDDRCGSVRRIVSPFRLVFSANT